MNFENICFFPSFYLPIEFPLVRGFIIQKRLYYTVSMVILYGVNENVYYFPMLYSIAVGRSCDLSTFVDLAWWLERLFVELRISVTRPSQSRLRCSQGSQNVWHGVTFVSCGQMVTMGCFVCDTACILFHSTASFPMPSYRFLQHPPSKYTLSIQSGLWKSFPLFIAYWMRLWYLNMHQVKQSTTSIYPHLFYPFFLPTFVFL